MAKSLLLFVHGLGGDATETWRKPGRPGFMELVREDRELSQSFDVGAYSYPTTLFPVPLLTRPPRIQELADGLRTQIENQYASYESIGLVCHSLGGLVARKYLIDEVRRGRRLRVTRLLLYAVPNNGASLAGVARLVSWRHRQIAQLCRSSDLVEFLNEDWASLEMGDRLAIKFVIAGQDAIVERTSAAAFWGNPDTDTVIDRGHVDLVKPAEAGDLAFLILKGFVDETPLPAAVDMSHGQGEWDGLRDALLASHPDLVVLEQGASPGWNALGRARVMIIPPPFRSQLTPEEVSRVRKAVERGSGLLLMGCYAADTHHGGNPTRLARQFGFAFGDDLVMPKGVNGDDCRRHVFRLEDALAVSTDVGDPAGHPLADPLVRPRFLSSCTVDVGSAPGLEFVLKSDPSAGVWHPEGPLGADEWKRQIIERWVPAATGAVPLLAASRAGRGRVVVCGTWKLWTLKTPDNARLLANLIHWLSPS
jgi:hypothetical protein